MMHEDEGYVAASGLFLDLFNGAAVGIASHISDSGHAWSVLAGGLSLNGSGALYGTASENVAQVVGLSAPDCTLVWNVNTGPNTTTATVGGAFRISSLNNLVYWDDYQGDLRLLKKNQGNYIQIDAAATQFAVNTSYEVKVVLLDISIKVYVNNVLKINATDAFNKTAGGVGIRTSFASSGAGARILDMDVTA